MYSLPKTIKLITSIIIQNKHTDTDQNKTRELCDIMMYILYILYDIVSEKRLLYGLEYNQHVCLCVLICKNVSI